jgi:enoyl-CoA hydratase
MTEYDFITYTPSADGRVVRIMLDRPETRNAQNRGMLTELHEAFLRAEADDEVRVVVLGGNGTMFSSGHDLGTPVRVAEREPGPNQHWSHQVNGGTRAGAEKRMLQEWQWFFEATRRWRDLRKITVAEVHGKVFSAGLMLMWACDLIVAEENAEFADVVGTRMGMCGVEYFAHPWEFGLRKTKELMLTGDSLTAEEAYRLGMVSKLFTRETLTERTDAFAAQIAELPTMTALMVKESVNQTQDIMGFHNALNACFTLHQLNHSHWGEIHHEEIARAKPEDGIPPWKDAPPVTPATRDGVGSLFATVPGSAG